MATIYNETIKVDSFKTLTNRFCEMIQKSPFIIVGEAFSRLGEGKKMDLIASDTFDFDIDKVNKSTSDILYELKCFVIHNINEFTLKETYCFLIKALADYKKSYKRNPAKLFEYLKEGFTRPSDFQGMYYFPFEMAYNENEYFKKKFDEKFNDYAYFYKKSGDELFNYIKDIYNQYFSGRLVANSRLKEFESEEELDKAIKRNQLEIMKYVFEEHRPIFVLHEDFDLSSLNSNGQVELSKYNTKQKIILFELLIKRRILIEYEKESLIILLSGGSKQNLNRYLSTSKNKILQGKKVLRKKDNVPNEYAPNDLEEVYNDLLNIAEELKDKIENVKAKIEAEKKAEAEAEAKTKAK